MPRNDKYVRDRIAVLPTLAVRPTATASPATEEPSIPMHQDAASIRDIGIASKPSNAAAAMTEAPADPEASRYHSLEEQLAARRDAMAALIDGPGGAPPGPSVVARPPQWIWIAPLTLPLAMMAAGWLFYRSEVANPAGDDLAHTQQALEQERRKVEKLSHELSTAWREVMSQTAVLADKAALDLELTDLRQDLRQAEGRSAAYEQLLADERARYLQLEEELTARRAVAALASNVPVPPQAAETDVPAPAPLAQGDGPVKSAAYESATPEAGATALEAPGNPETDRLMVRASLLLAQGDIGGARVVLDHAADMGSALALFALAETYDPFVLSEWKTFGTQGDAAKARELYTRALAGGVTQAKERLKALR